MRALAQQRPHANASSTPLPCRKAPLNPQIAAVMAANMSNPYMPCASKSEPQHPINTADAEGGAAKGTSQSPQQGSSSSQGYER